ncbi:ABC transporter permease [Devosia neptuniae]|uniref:ABC transporter permease n=1 Tax=Devosia neptuniae TaxID=191302 RepID=A0ABY6CH94_9HYPH|nr:ABC transporter permease [Devosia neptuniae]UXN69433.1 ABC transporter permease [Devosia neptuniae]
MNRKLRPSPLVLLAFLVLALFIGIAAFAPWVAPYDVSKVVGGVWEPPSATALLGTDNLGRDLLSRIIWGAQITLSVAALATLIAFIVGVALGLLAAMQRGWVDQALSRGNDLLMAIPTLIFALVVLAVLPKNVVVLVLVMAALDATRVFRVSRAVATDIAVLDYVEVARMRGEGWGWIMLREILPNAAAPLLAEFGMRFAFAVLFLSTLSFLGLGIQPPVADWGSLVKENKDGLLFGIFAALIPGGAIVLLAVSVNLIVDWVLTRAAHLRGELGNG